MSTSRTSNGMTPQPGQVVRVRSGQYLVEAVTPPPGPRQQTLVRRSCLDGDAQGAELEVLWEGSGRPGASVARCGHKEAA